MRVARKFTTPAYWPRTDSRSLQYRGATLDVVYTVQSEELPVTPPSDTKLNLLFVHGAQCSKEAWNYWIDLSFQHWGKDLDKCITMDHVHAGDSAILNQGRAGYFIPWDDLGRDVGMVIRDCIRRGEISARAPLIVVGHSLGGAASMCLSVYDPGLVTALVLADPVWMGADADFSEIDGYGRQLAKISLAVTRNARDEFESLDDYYEYTDKKYITAKMQPQIKKDLSDGLYYVKDGKIRMKTSGPMQGAHYYGGIAMVGLGQSIIRRVRVPAIVFHGDIIDFNPPGSNESLQQILGKAERVVVPGGGHLVPFTKPDDSFNAVKDFITKEYKAQLEHRDEVDKLWGSTPEEKFLTQASLQVKGGHPAGLSRL